MSTSNVLFDRKLFFFLAACIVAFVVFVASGARSQVRVADNAQDLDTLLAKKQYPELEQALDTQVAELSKETRAYFWRVMANRLNQVQKSLTLLEPLIPHLLINDARRGEIAVCTVADDYAKSFRFRDAARVYAEASRIAQQQKLNSSCDAARERDHWALFEDAPPQSLTSGGDFVLPGHWDAMGLIQVPVNAGAYSGSWILDSGANLSLISQSVAEQMGLQVSTSVANAEGGSGRALLVHTAVIPELHLGPAVVRNLPVLVAADRDLDFPNLNYRIEGGLGLPILAAFGAVTIYNDGQVRFAGAPESAQSVPNPHNLYLEKFTPLITASFGLGDQLFAIDTGAAGTILSSAFYRESTPVDTTEFVQLELLGAGGSLVAPAYQVRGVGVQLGGSCATIAAVQVLTQPTGAADEFYGNIGENALRSFRSFTLDFTHMRFSVNPGTPRNCNVVR